MSEKTASPGTVKISNVRLSFPKIFKPEAFGNGDPKYSASFLIDPETDTGKENIKKIEKAIKAVCDEKWGAGKHPKFKADHMCYFDGDEKDYDGYEGMKVIASSEKRPPVLIDRDRSALNESVCMTEDKLYAGCYVNAVVNFWTYDRKTDEGLVVKGFGSNLRAIQYVGPGERFGGGEGIDTDEWFDDESEGSDDDL